MKCEAITGTGGRRLHRSAGRARRAWARCSSGYFEGDDFVFAGKVGHRLRHRKLLRESACARSTRCEVPASPFTRADGLPRLRVHWARPEIVVQVALHRMDGARQAAPSSPARGPPRQGARARSCGSTVITHPEKVLFPDDGITKGELAGVLRSDRVRSCCPTSQARPVTMERFPSGIGRPGFMPEGRGERVSRSGSSASTVPKKDGSRALSTLVSGCALACSGWPTRTASRRTSGRRAARPLDRPDICVFDLDPSADDPERCAASRWRCVISLAGARPARAGSRRPARKGSTSSSRSTASTASAGRAVRRPCRARCSSRATRAPHAGVRAGRLAGAASSWLQSAATGNGATFAAARTRCGRGRARPSPRHAPGPSGERRGPAAHVRLAHHGVPRRAGRRSLGGSGGLARNRWPRPLKSWSAWPARGWSASRTSARPASRTRARSR